MATAGEVMTMLRPLGGWITTGDEYNNVEFLECEKVSEAQFIAGFAQYDAWKASQDADKAQAKVALLAKLGITADEAALLLS